MKGGKVKIGRTRKLEKGMRIYIPDNGWAVLSSSPGDLCEMGVGPTFSVVFEGIPGHKEEHKRIGYHSSYSEKEIRDSFYVEVSHEA